MWNVDLVQFIPRLAFGRTAHGRASSTSYGSFSMDHGRGTMVSELESPLIGTLGVRSPSVEKLTEAHAGESGKTA